MLIWINRPSYDSRTFLLLDRDGVINEDRPDYIKHPCEFRFYPDALEALRWLRERHIPVVIISNQSGLNRGLIAWEDFWDMHEGMIKGIQSEGGDILGAFYCPHRPEEACSCRKPSPGMIHAAAAIFQAPLSETYFIGDRRSDLLAASCAGCRGVFLDRFGAGVKQQPPDRAAKTPPGTTQDATVESNPAQQLAHRTAPQNEVTITPGRHSRMLLAEIQKNSRDARLRGHNNRMSDTHLGGAGVGTQHNSLSDAASEPIPFFSNLMDAVCALFETQETVGNRWP